MAVKERPEVPRQGLQECGGRDIIRAKLADQTGGSDVSFGQTRPFCIDLVPPWISVMAVPRRIVWSC